jgi:hypothetical protein
VTRRRLLALGVAALAGAALLAALRPVTVLELENAGRARTLRAAVAEGEPFAVVYHHSMYDAPVSEEFVLARGRVLLEAVSSPSAAVREYFGLAAAGERHRVARSMPEVVFRVAAGVPQRLRVRGATISFLEVGEHGDRLVLRAGRAPAILRWSMDPFAATP